MNNHPLQELVKLQKDGMARGICSVCSSSPFVIDAALMQGKKTGTYVLIEATANQVNQMGGYTGMKPIDFKEWVHERAQAIGLDESRIILGGDHLGPVAWKKKTAEEAMDLAETLVREFVKAGYTKIHIDTSMPLGEEVTLSTEEIADRAVRLCLAAEEEAKAKNYTPVYVIGSEVPTPGGSGDEDELSVTKPQDLIEMLDCFKTKFEAAGLGDAWKRVVAAVVQPGVEFGNDNVHEYVPAEAVELTKEAKSIEGIMLEGHSTDYQNEASLAAMVRDGVGILKVGPALTFAAREGMFALAEMEDLYAHDFEASNFVYTLDKVMLEKPDNWAGHYTNVEPESTFLRKFSYSDRSRYYMNEPEIKESLDKLIANLEAHKVPMTLLSQYMPAQYIKVRTGELANDPTALIIDKVTEVLDVYWRACGLMK